MHLSFRVSITSTICASNCGKKKGTKKSKNREVSRIIIIIKASIILEVIHQFTVSRSDICSISSAGSGQAGHDHTVALLRLLEDQK